MAKKIKQADGIVSQCSSRVAKSGSYAHSFFIGKQKYSLFTLDEIHPVMDGDRVRFEYEVRHLRSGRRGAYCAIIPESLCVDAPHQVGAAINGLVYILSNPSLKNLLKIGHTTRTAKERAAELSGQTGTPTPFRVEWTLPVIGDPMAVEKRAHILLTSKREGKEFFRVSLEEAKSACLRSFAETHPEQADRMDEAHASRAKAVLQRREELTQIKNQRESEQKKLEEKRSFWTSPQGKWLSDGRCAVVLHSYDYPPNKSTPSIFQKLLGKKFEDYLDLEISADEQNAHVEWRTHVHGRLSERGVWTNQKFLTLDEGLMYARKSVESLVNKNYQLIVTIPVCLIENPPDCPRSFALQGQADKWLMQDSGFGASPYAFLIPSIEGLVIRPDPYREERNALFSKTLPSRRGRSWPK